MSRFLLLLAFTVSFTLLGCSEDSPADPSGDAANTFRLNGAGYSNKLLTAPASDQGVFCIETSDGTGTVGLLAIDGSDVYGASMVMQNVAPGTFPVSAAGGVALTMTITRNGNVTLWFAESGSIKIETWAGPGGRGKGTFEGTLKNGSETMTVVGNFDDASIVLED